MAEMKYNEIKCPACGSTYDDERFGHVSYWGEDPHELWCSECDHKFTVEETVERTYEYVEGG